MTSNIFVAGATGVIGRRLVPLLVARGWRVHASTRSIDKAPSLAAAGATPAVVDAFDAPGLEAAVRAAHPEVVVHLLTDLPAGLDASRMEEGMRRNARMRREGTANLVVAAQAAGARRIVAQSIAWAYAPGTRPFDETQPLDLSAEGLRGISVGGVSALETAVLAAPGIDATVLRFGQLYGPGTGSDDANGKAIPLHIDACAAAFVLAIEARRPGIYNIAEANGEVSTHKAQSELGWDAIRR